MKELEQQGIEDYEFFDGMYLPSIKESINRSHKQIVEYAMLSGWEEVVIAEDDVRFLGNGAWVYFLSNKPTDYDLYLGGCYVPEFNQHKTLQSFCGLHLYMVHERFYETFLNITPYDHLDRSLAGKGKFVLSDPIVAEQYDGISSNTGKEEKYRHLLVGMNLFGN